jgi:Ca2+-transporting ATPase
MRRPPIARREPLITRDMWKRLAVMTPAIVVVTLGWFIVRLWAGVPFEVARTETFTLLAVCEWFNVLNCLSDRRSALRLDVLRSPWLLGGLLLGNALQLAVVYLPAMNQIFHTAPIQLVDALAIGAVGSLVLWAEEVRKWRS